MVILGVCVCKCIHFCHVSRIKTFVQSQMEALVYSFYKELSMRWMLTLWTHVFKFPDLPKIVDLYSSVLTTMLHIDAVQNGEPCLQPVQKLMEILS